MEPHIEATIGYLRQQVLKIENVIDTLLTLTGEEVQPAPKPESVKVEVKPPAKPPRVMSHKAHNTAKGPHAPRTGNLQALQTLAEPFGVPELRKAADLTRRAASSQIHRWKADGIIRKVGFGQYERAKKTVVAAVAVKLAPAPALTFPRAKLESDLAAALKQRDSARAAGRETVVDIFQQDVDRITAQLEAL